MNLEPHAWHQLGHDLTLPENELEKIGSKPDSMERSLQVLQKWASGVRAPYVEHILYALEKMEKRWAIKKALKPAYPGVGREIEPPQWT